MLQFKKLKINSMKNKINDFETSAFYDQFWHRNVPNYEETKNYMFNTITGRSYSKSLDAGCGHGICSVILSDISISVDAVDISPKCIETAKVQSQKFNRSNIIYHNQDLQVLDLQGKKFDLIWCWGVAMMAPKPLDIIDNLVESMENNSELYIGLYLKTWLSPIHELIRKLCVNYMNTPRRKKFVLDFFTLATKIVFALKFKKVNLRDDNISIQTQVEDWYYPPYKTFYSIDFIIEYLEKKGLIAKCIQDRVGRLKSATIFVIKAEKK